MEDKKRLLLDIWGTLKEVVCRDYERVLMIATTSSNVPIAESWGRYRIVLGWECRHKKFHLQTSTRAGCYTYIRLVKVHSRDESGADPQTYGDGNKEGSEDAVTLFWRSFSGYFQDIVFPKETIRPG